MEDFFLFIIKGTYTYHITKTDITIFHITMHMSKGRDNCANTGIMKLLREVILRVEFCVHSDS